jgi:hypothetical protein
MRCSVFRYVATIALALASCATLACEGPKPPPSKPCDQACQDRVAVRGVRETMKLAYNLTLQGKDVGTHDERIPCLRGGSARVFGKGTSKALQGTTEVELTYEFDRCLYRQRDDEPDENFELTISGTVEQKGTLAVSAGATTALFIKAATITAAGTVYDPPIEYAASECELEVSQNGSNIGGDFCGRTVAFPF